jgi:hypothetical protein
MQGDSRMRRSRREPPRPWRRGLQPARGLEAILVGPIIGATLEVSRLTSADKIPFLPMSVWSICRRAGRSSHPGFSQAFRDGSRGCQQLARSERRM